MSEKDKLTIDIQVIMQQLKLDEDKWHQLNHQSRLTLQRQKLLNLTKRTIKLARRIMI